MNTLKKKLSQYFNNKSIVIYFSLIILLISALFFQKNKMEKQMQLKVQFIEQKNMLRDELDDLIDEHDDLLDEYGNMNSQLDEKDSIIQHQISEIRDLIRNKNDLFLARKKINILKKISKKYLAKVDSLLISNEKLSLEKDSVINANKKINWKNYTLNRQNEQLAEKVSKGSVLEILDVDIKTLRYRSTGKEVVTRFARKVQKVRICFTVSANQISDAEEKLVYAQILSRDGELIVGNKDIFVEINGVKTKCTHVSSFDYKNQEIFTCLEWERYNQLQEGLYFVNLIIEGKVLSQAEFNLR